VAEHNADPAPLTSPLTSGFLTNLRFDVLSGFLVFLIAMPLCLGIAKASNYPAIAGIWTAVIGGVLTTLLSNSQLTIKGPAAGLIVVVASSVVGLGKAAVPELTPDAVAAIQQDVQQKGGSPADLQKALDEGLQARQLEQGYSLALGAAVAAGLLQVLMGLFKVGTLGELVPLMPVHGMLAAIGITIVARSLFPMLGIASPPADWTPIEVIVAIPGKLGQCNVAVATVGLLSLAILVAFSYAKARVKALKSVPSQVIVLAVAIPLGLALNLTGSAMVSVPNILADPGVELPNAFHAPEFGLFDHFVWYQAVVMFCLIASIESLLSTQAIDMIDPWRRKTNMNRDLAACGVANTLCACVGALPMISEIVRSKANIDNGARTKYANLFHALFLLAFVLLLPFVINIIPTAALGAMLVFVGFRLASPNEFVHTWKVGPEQLAVFVTTILVTLSTDLLIGVVSGIALKVLFHLIYGVPIGAFWRPEIEVVERDTVAVLVVKKAAVFSNWLAVRGAILKAAHGREEVMVDLAQTRLVDHSVMEKLHQLEKEFADNGKRLRVVGLDFHRPMSAHPLAARIGPRFGDVPQEQLEADELTAG
jgi:MFS superfamily sulfate permease-like transporter